MQRIEQDGPIYYRFERGLDSVTHGVFTRLGGVSRAPWASLNVGGTVGDSNDAVQRNLHMIYDSLEVEADKVCSVWQVHSADTVVASEAVPGRRWIARADGIVTNQPGVPLTMRFADCVPILFFDPVQKVIGIAHAGWRGTIGGVAASTIRTMEMAYGSNPEDIHAAIGPSIGPDHYQVGPEVVEAVQHAFGTTEELIRRASDGSTYLDLWESNRLALQRAGVSGEHIEIAGICTASNTDEFYSHRAERGKTGRFCAVIALS